MTANAIATTATHTLEAVGNIIPSLPKLIELGFTPKILLGFVIAGGVVYIVDKAIDAGYIVTGSYEPSADRYEFGLKPVMVEA